jgi:hypothetical protein
MEPKKETFYHLNVQTCTNGFILYVNENQRLDRCVPDKTFVFNTLKDLSDFLLTFKEING